MAFHTVYIYGPLVVYTKLLILIMINLYLLPSASLKSIAITEIYEQSKIVAGQDGSNYDVEQLWAWLDDAFPRLDVFIFDKEISRYKHTSRMEFKELFIQQLEKLSDSQEITCAKRRTSRLANDDDLIEDEISDWDDD